jgi:hypothetical protein
LGPFFAFNLGSLLGDLGDIVFNQADLRSIGPADLEVIALACGLLEANKPITPGLLEFCATVIFHAVALVGDFRQGELTAREVLLQGFGLDVGSTH